MRVEKADRYRTSIRNVAESCIFGGCGVSWDKLDALVEANKGEQAFELAEAGIEIAKAHLADDPTYSDWSSGDLSLEEVGEDSVTVVMGYDEEGATFVATSTREYGGTKRKIEAVFSIEDGSPELVGWRELYE